MANLLSLDVSTPQGPSGVLSKETGKFFFGYGRAAASAAISLTMPVRVSQYVWPALHPVFQMNLPEGFMLEALRNRFAKVMTLDPMLLLAISGGPAAIGRVRVASPRPEFGVPTEPLHQGESLSEILAWDGAESLFAALVDRYLLRAGISGVQPKVLVPEARPAASAKATVVTQDLIVKSGRKEYPGLAANEFLCMSMAKEAGLLVPEFFLSKDHELFVMRRFDRTAKGDAIGFEDMAVLTGRSAEQKYLGSYAELARVVRIFASPAQVQESLHALFDSVALSCIVGNGDAHLKNFGLLYSDPTLEDCRLAPAFDIVNTTSYLPEDVLALTLGGNKSFFASRQGILDLARSCDVHDVPKRIEKLLLAVERVISREAEIADTIPAVLAAVQQGAEQFQKTFCP